ncbi:MAG: FHA domain-containing protein [Prevotellaceae bacterium]|nr:FHA domain-containing protein [Prevotellaceae bacterium]
MIICPNCKEEIDSGSHYCDQCGKMLMYCAKCGHVGTGRRCTLCGGLMITAEELELQNQQTTMSEHSSMPSAVTSGQAQLSTSLVDMSIPQLTLVNHQLNLNMRAINGAIIGRRQGPYKAMFEQNKYVSGIHAQLFYRNGEGWCIMDKHSSNGTMLNRHRLMPDVCMTLNNGDLVTIANVNLQVIINNVSTN